MKLVELSDVIQTLCQDGWSEHDIEFWTHDTGILFPEELELRIKSDVMANGYVKVKLDTITR